MFRVNQPTWHHPNAERRKTPLVPPVHAGFYLTKASREPKPWIAVDGSASISSWIISAGELLPNERED